MPPPSANAASKPSSHSDRPFDPARSRKHYDRANPQAQNHLPTAHKPKALARSTDSHQTSLSLKGAEFPNPPPSRALYPHLTRLDLTDIQGGLEGIGAGWIGREWGSQLTWLGLGGCHGLGGMGREAWDGFEKLTGLVVLNVPGCNLTSIPSQFSQLSSLKALVAIHNKLTELDDSVVSHWSLLNSLIVSHNPLTSLPSALASLPQLAKLSASNTALTSTGLPNLSQLPYLRVLSLSHNASLSTLPSHFSKWGTGALPASDKKATGKFGEGRRGDGLEVIELGGCGIKEWGVLEDGLGEMEGLRSLGLKGCEVTQIEDYRDQITSLLPSLQILDNQRLVERKNKGVLPTPKPKPKREPRAFQPTGANAYVTSGDRAPVDPQPEQGSVEEDPPMEVVEEKDQPEMKKRKRKPHSAKAGLKENDSLPSFSKKRSLETATDVEPTKKRKRGTHSTSTVEPAPVSTPKEPTPPPPVEPEPTPVSSAAKAKKPVVKSETSVLKVIQVKEAKKKVQKRHNLDLKEVFGKKDAVDGLGLGGTEGQSEGGLGVGGWDD